MRGDEALLRGASHGDQESENGEEQPAVGGEDEAANARNRRVELVYTAE
mgnify:CR=1 FL=1